LIQNLAQGSRVGSFKLVEIITVRQLLVQIENEHIEASCRVFRIHITKSVDECADMLFVTAVNALEAGFTVSLKKVDELVQRLKMIAAENYLISS
jgi:hypothetical protein